MLRNVDIQISGSNTQKVFMKRFCVHPIFVRLVNWAKGWHEICQHDSDGHNRCPTELKFLGWLHIVGHAACFDDVEELIRISASTMHHFFHQFSRRCRDKLYPSHVKMPSTEEELVEIEATYAVLGIPGACGSMDVVHIPLGTCPHVLFNVCIGNEGYPTLG